MLSYLLLLSLVFTLLMGILHINLDFYGLVEIIKKASKLQVLKTAWTVTSIASWAHCWDCAAFDPHSTSSSVVIPAGNSYLRVEQVRKKIITETSMIFCQGI